jgi:NAD(P)H-dependent FMN reductase
VFGGKPVAVIGVTPGGLGTVLAQDAWLGVLRLLGTRPWFGGRLTVAHAGKLFDADGQLTDADTRERLRTFMGGFVQSVREGKNLPR